MGQVGFEVVLKFLCRQKKKDKTGGRFCICGTALVKRKVKNIYHKPHIDCDSCASKKCMVYHCPNRAIDKHPNGFDVCANCANQAMSDCNIMMLMDQILPNVCS